MVPRSSIRIARIGSATTMVSRPVMPLASVAGTTKTTTKTKTTG